jgi:hypothetical protein
MEVRIVFTIRNIGGVALFLFGTTYMWLTPAFAGKGVSTKGAWWSISQVLVFATMLGFMIATWGLFRKSGWWEIAAIVSAIVGLVALIPYWVAAQLGGEITPWFNVLVHAVGAAGVLVLLLVPTLQNWVSGHVMAGA